MAVLPSKRKVEEEVKANVPLPDAEDDIEESQMKRTDTANDYLLATLATDATSSFAIPPCPPTDKPEEDENKDHSNKAEEDEEESGKEKDGENNDQEQDNDNDNDNAATATACQTAQDNVCIDTSDHIVNVHTVDPMTVATQSPSQAPNAQPDPSPSTLDLLYGLGTNNDPPAVTTQEQVKATVSTKDT